MFMEMLGLFLFFSFVFSICFFGICAAEASTVFVFLGEHKQGRGREKGIGDLKWADSSEPDVGFELPNREIMT